MASKSWTKKEDEYLKDHFMEMDHESMGNVLGRTRNAVRKRCFALKLRKKEKAWTNEEIERLKMVYQEHEGKYLDLDAVAEDFGRSRFGIAMKASKLGISSMERPKSADVIEGISIRVKKWYEENEHPKGMLGKKHKESTKKQNGEKIKAMWKDPNSKVNSKEYREKRAKISSKQMIKQLKEKPNWTYSNALRGQRKDLGETFFRSRWEANYARYLNHLKDQGDIYEWEFEPHTFKFPDQTERPYSYTPDFRIYKTKHSKPEYHEIKGWMDELSKKKLALMNKHYLDVSLIVIGEPEYMALENEMGEQLLNWEFPRIKKHSS